MSFWGVMNYITWALCGVFIYLLAKDFIKVEKLNKINSKDREEIK